MEWPSLSDESTRRQLAMAGIGVLGGTAVLGGAMWLIRSQAKSGDILRVRLIHDVDPASRQLIASYLPVVNFIASHGIDVRVRFGPKPPGEKGLEIPVYTNPAPVAPPGKPALGYDPSRIGALMTHVLDAFGADLASAALVDTSLPASRREDEDLDNDDDLIESVLSESEGEEGDADDEVDEPEDDSMALLMGSEMDRPAQDDMSEEKLLRALMQAQGED